MFAIDEGSADLVIELEGRIHKPNTALEEAYRYIIMRQCFDDRRMAVKKAETLVSSVTPCNTAEGFDNVDVYFVFGREF